ncbi:MAG TPA: DUF1365 domain-containing protein [Rhizomicrobium sp.]|nr:DUF1365 domain-containing protein [Rhizomicrobium sp.]
MNVSAIYEGSVMHRRLKPRTHRFRYRVFAVLLELDELTALDRDLRLFKHNRWGLFSFHDKDHGPIDSKEPHDLNLWLDDLLAQNGIEAKGPRRVLCYPRILGHVFNPLSVWFCDDRQGRLKAIVYEVHNTYQERHAYVLPVPDGETPGAVPPEHRPGHATHQTIRHGCAKSFYVSPFLSRDCRYDFRIRPPDQHVAIVIQEQEAGVPILHASFAGARRPLTDGALARMLLRYPLMTLKVVAAIHFEAVRLMLKGVRRHPHAPKAVYTLAE